MRPEYIDRASTVAKFYSENVRLNYLNSLLELQSHKLFTDFRSLKHAASLTNLSHDIWTKAKVMYNEVLGYERRAGVATLPVVGNKRDTSSPGFIDIEAET